MSGVEERQFLMNKKDQQIHEISRLQHTNGSQIEQITRNEAKNINYDKIS